MIFIATGKFDNFEYDTRGIVSSFFPGEEIVFNESAPANTDTNTFVIELEKIIPHGLAKNEMRKALYAFLKEKTKRELPWGILIGIRPTKIARKLIEEGMSPADVTEHLRDEYFVSKEKAELATMITDKEIKLLEGHENAYSIYIGIPFCPSKCLYCSFTSYPIEKYADRVSDYLNALFKEIDWAAKNFPAPHTIYIGGGTPTSLNEKELDLLLKKVTESFDMKSACEFTVEAGRPDSITKEKLEVMKSRGVNRISINPQSMNDKTLKLIGRNHSSADIVRKFNEAREVGFDNINMDIILGLPGEKAEDVARTMDALFDLGPDSLTVHALAVKRASRLRMETEGVPMPGFSDEESRKMMDVADKKARDMGLHPYYLYRQKNMAGALENVGYSFPGREGIYNIAIIEETESIIALGAGTVSKVKRSDGTLERCDTHKDVDLYISEIDKMIERKEKLFAKDKN